MLEHVSYISSIETLRVRYLQVGNQSINYIFGFQN
jgi:hypothetical protein